METARMLGKAEYLIAEYRRALQRIIDNGPKEKPPEYDGVIGNEDDAYAMGADASAWHCAEIARKALSETAHITI